MISRRALLLVLALLPWTWACDDDPAGPEVRGRTVGVVLESTDLSLTVFDVEDPTSTTTVALGPDGSPVSLAVRGRFAAVPLGIVPAVAVVDLGAGEVVRTVGLPEGSGATGAVFVNDSIVLVGNPDRGTVSPVNVRAGTAGAEIDVGRYPQSFIATDARIYVVDAELESFVPVGPSTLKVLDRASFALTDTIELSGENAAAGVVGPDGALWVLHSGSFGAANGSLSRVDPGAGVETDHHEGFGEFPGALAFGGDGLLRVAGFGIGVLVWDPATESFVRGPGDPVAPGGLASTAAVGADAEGRIYALLPECQQPSEVHRLDQAHGTEAVVAVGTCPIAIAFTELDGA